jgi:hypothetical protein
MRPPRLPTVVVIVIVTLGASCGGALTGSTGDQSGAPSGTEAATPEQNLIDKILAEMGTKLTDASVAKAPAGAPPGEWLSATYPSYSGLASKIRLGWEIQLLAGAYNAEAPGAGLAQLSGIAEIDPKEQVKDSNGTTNPETIAGVFAYRSVDPTGESDSSIVSAITANVEHLGLSPVSVSVEHADGPAPVVVVQADDPAAFLSVGHTYTDVFGDGRFIGSYLEVEDSSGKPVAAVGNSARTQGGNSWSDPSLGVTIGSSASKR